MNKNFLLSAIGLTVLILFVYGQSLQFDFISFDDDAYIIRNQHVNTGISAANIHWAFTESHSSNWHPVTWISHMLDVDLFGLNAGGHHATNLIFHSLNTLLLLLFFRLVAINQLAATTMAALFALHPMHVESVVWIAERKDMLSTFFMLLTMIAYSRYVRQRTIAAYGLVLLFCALGLMSKTMLVTLPLLLLLLDYYPLKRFDLGNPGTIEPVILMKRLGWLFAEKIPLLLLAVATLSIAYQTQQDAMATGAILSLKEKLINALIAYSHYMTKAIIPGNLGIFYPHPAQWPVVELLKAMVILVAVTFFAVWHIRSRPYIIVGWLWFLGTLVPVIGLIQIGNQYMADRYSYIPYIGLFLMLIPLLFELLNKLTRGKQYYIAIVVLLISVYSISTWQYVTHWRDSISIFGHTLRITDPNYEYFLGMATDAQPDSSGMLAGLWTSYYNMGNALAARGRFQEALRHLDLATQLAPHLLKAHNNKALVLAALGRKQEAIDVLTQILKVQPDDERARMNLENLAREPSIMAPESTDS